MIISAAAGLNAFQSVQPVDGLQGFVEGPRLYTADMRHAAVQVDGTALLVFYSIVGESPERIVFSTIDLTRS